jgi:hypothetical protein
MDACCSAVHQFMLKGLSEDAAHSLCLADAPNFYASHLLWSLIRRCAGNPYLVHQVARIAQSQHGGNNGFLDQTAQDTLLRTEIGNLLQESIERLSPLEHSCIQIIFDLANNGEPTTIASLRRNLLENPASPVSTDTSVMEALSSLGRRSLLQPVSGRYELNRLVMEYATVWLTEANDYSSDT